MPHASKAMEENGKKGRPTITLLPGSQGVPGSLPLFARACGVCFARAGAEKTLEADIFISAIDLRRCRRWVELEFIPSSFCKLMLHKATVTIIIRARNHRAKVRYCKSMEAPTNLEPFSI